MIKNLKHDDKRIFAGEEDVHVTDDAKPVIKNWICP
jgi:hypothetical protein